MRHFKLKHIYFLTIVSLLFNSCSWFHAPETDMRSSVVLEESRIVGTDGNSGKMFDILTAGSTGLEFMNTIPDNYEDNYWRYVFVYNGGSVNIADFNNDGLPDIFFTGVHVPHRLFMNKGNLQFEDVTTASGITKADFEWTSGSTTADVNGDGLMDIYICNTRREKPEHRRNKLYINNGNFKFTEAGKQFGLDDDATCSAANFFDYDNDGDLDMYLVTHPMDFINKFKTIYFQKIEEGKNLSDKLFRNNGDGTFTDVHLETGINNHGFGLACSVGDVNEDGFLDIYVANDFGMYDFLYLNNGNGTFKDVSLTAIKRHVVSSMGVDIADMNNDGLLDIYNADIEMEENYTYKTFQVSSQIEVVRILVNAGYGYQKHGNSLKLNNGNGTFSEIARSANVGVTDWAWSPFFADFDNDGWKDLFVSTGYLQDFAIDETETYNKLRRACRISDSSVYYQLMQSLPRNVLNHPNFIYKNNGNYTFTDKRDDWGVYFPSVSYGAATADFDLDGDLDIVCSNANDHPFLYRNNSEKTVQNNYLQIVLSGYKQNTAGLGTKIYVYYDNQKQYVQHTNVRGYISTTENKIHFGLGKYNKADKIEIIWPDGKYQELLNVAANQILYINYSDATTKETIKKIHPALQFTDITAATQLNYTHVENEYDDYLREFVLPHKMSTNGPSMACGDVDGNGLDDVYFGGSIGHKGKLFLQKSPHQFVPGNNNFELSGTTDDGGVLIFDADGDKDNDIYISSGGNELPAFDKGYNDRLYINDGDGNFKLNKNALPEMPFPKSCILACDFDKDGDEDVFVGGRQVPGAYLQPASSYLLRNDNGKFIDVTASLAAGLKNIGMVTAGLWSDYDNDGKTDLLICGDWMPFTVFRNTGKAFENITSSLLLKETDGWWQSMNGGDFDNDGDIDYVLGNFGTNRRYINTKSEKDGRNLPAMAYLKDFDASGNQDLVLAYYQHDNLYPVQLRERLLEQIPGLRKNVPSWDWYGKATVQDIFGFSLNDAITRYAYTFKSVVLKNNGKGKFEMLPLPNLAQISVVMGTVVTDVNADGKLDIILHGNHYQTDIIMMRHDAGTGLVLFGNGDGTFKESRSMENGFWSDGEGRSLGLVSAGENNAPLLVGTLNSGNTFVYEFTNAKVRMLEADDAYATITMMDGSVQKMEVYKGCGYLAQQSRFVLMHAGVKSVRVLKENAD